MKNNLKILVTGANGYVGSKVVKELCDMGFSVTATSLTGEFVDSRAKFVAIDIFSKDENWFTFFDKPDICLHLAWRDGFVHNSDAHMEDLSKHYIFITNLINNGLRHFASLGTMHEIGYFEGPINEDTTCNPLSQYGIAKNALRKSIALFCEQHKCDFQWLRAFYIYGSDEIGNSIFSKIQSAARNGQKVFPFTLGENKYDFIAVEELAKQISLAITQNKILGIINCCSGKPVSLSEKIEWYIKKNNLDIKLDYGKFPNRPYDSPCIYGDDAKIKLIIKNSKKKEEK